MNKAEYAAIVNLIDTTVHLANNVVIDPKITPHLEKLIKERDTARHVLQALVEEPDTNVATVGTKPVDAEGRVMHKVLGVIPHGGHGDDAFQVVLPNGTTLREGLIEAMYVVGKS
jgi:hypothetical protein